MEEGPILPRREGLEVPDTPCARQLLEQLEEWAWFTDWGMLCIWERFTFDFCFKLLLHCGLDHEEAMFWMLAECDFSALTWQERIHNKAYRKLSDDEFLSQDLAKEFMDFIGRNTSQN